MSEAKYPISYVSSETGLNQILIRTWENRYDFLHPERSKGNRRLYTEKQLEKLILIKKAIDKGFKIGQLAEMSLEDIKAATGSEKTSRIYQTSSGKYLEEALNFIKNFDNGGLKKLIDTVLVKETKKNFILNFILPLLAKIGCLWEKGDLKVSNEHFASEIIRSALASLIEIPKNQNSPVVITGTPKNQYHELASLALSVLISMNGFKVLFIGASVPAEDIISAAQKTDAKTLVLSIIYPNDDPALLDDLKKLSSFLETTDIYIGGSSASDYYNNLKSTKIKYIDDIDAFLDNLKKSRKLDGNL